MGYLLIKHCEQLAAEYKKNDCDVAYQHMISLIREAKQEYEDTQKFLAVYLRD